MKTAKNVLFLKPQQIKTIFLRTKAENISMHRRFTIYVLLLLCSVIAFSLLLLSLFGILKPSDSRLRQALSHQLESSVAALENDVDTLASHAVIFSEQMTALLEKNLSDNNMSFTELTGDLDALTSLQSDAYLTVRSSMRIASCSGAFYFLNSTVNDSLAQPYYNGLYLKIANLFSENTVYNKVCLYRGAAAVARENDINLHSTWQNEMLAGVFTEVDALMNNTSKDLAQSYILTSVYTLPDTWEHARFLCVPILDTAGNTVGVCGFEISDLFFKLSYKTVDAELDQIVFALLDKTEDGYIGQISGSRSGYTPPAGKNFVIETKKNFSTIRCGDLLFYGNICDITVGNATHTLAVMLPEAQYKDLKQVGRSKAVAILFTVTAAAFVSCLWLGKHYVAPILKSFEQLKTNPRERLDTGILEINDLFDFLSQKDMEHDAHLQQWQRDMEQLQNEFENIQNEYQKTQNEFENIQSEYQKTQNEFEAIQSQYEKTQSEYEKAQLELDRLAYSRKQEVDPDNYRMFLDNLHTLTPTERTIFEHYLGGKSAKEILVLMEIKENTLKYHNRNIYSKLGVSSRKQLLRYAALMKQENDT